MIYHPIDFHSLKEMYNSYQNKTETDTGKIARKYNWEDKPESFKSKREKDDWWQKKYDAVAKRCKIMAEENLIFISKENGKNKYTLILDNVFIKKLKFPDGMSDALFIRERKSKWQIFQI